MTMHELYPFHEDAAVAGALGRLLVRREARDPEPFDAVADRFGVDPVRLEAAVYRLGVEAEVGDLPGRVDEATIPHRTAPESLAEREPVTRRRDGTRDPELEVSEPETYEMSFESRLLVEATKEGRSVVGGRLEDALGDGVDTLSVGTRAVLGTAPFPERVLFVGIAYPVNANEPGTVSAVANPPPFPFGDVEAILPGTVDVSVECGDETFVVRNVPVVAFEEYRSH